MGFTPCRTILHACRQTICQTRSFTTRARPQAALASEDSPTARGDDVGLQWASSQPNRVDPLERFIIYEKLLGGVQTNPRFQRHSQLYEQYPFASLKSQKARGPEAPFLEPEEVTKRLVTTVQHRLSEKHGLAIAKARRDLSSTESPHKIREILKDQLGKCKSSGDVLRLAAVALHRDRSAHEFAKLTGLLYSTLYKTRERSPDRSIAAAILGLIRRFQQRGLAFEQLLLRGGLTFAARGRSLRLMGAFLYELRRGGIKMNTKLMRVVIAKFSLGRRGLGELRNGRWKRDELMQVLFGFKDPLPGPAYHLETFLDRTIWQHLHSWVILLSRLGAKDALWREWELWKSSERRVVQISDRGKAVVVEHADMWFIRHMLIAGDPARAWEAFEQSGLDFFALPVPLRSVLLENLQYATIWNDRIKEDLVQKLDEDLNLLEGRLGLRWIKTGEDDTGYHIVEDNMSEILEQLSRPNYFDVHGFIDSDDNDSLLSQGEKMESQ
jgi:hypothetical protein